MLNKEDLEAGFRLGEWEVLPDHRVLRRDGEVVTPEPMVFDVLLALARREGALVTKDELIDEVWNGRAFSDEVIQQKISQLRSHFGDKRPFAYIGTLPRKGYQLLTPVELLDTHVVPPEQQAKSNRRSLFPWAAVAAIVVVGIVALAISNVWPPRTQAAVRSLAILPIDNLSGDPANGYIAEGIHRTLARRLSELPDRTIKIIRTPHEGDWAAMREELAVESLLIASVQIENAALRVDYQVINNKDVVILGGEESGSLDKIFALQERLAQAVYKALAGSKTPELIKLATPDSVAYDSYSRGMYLLEHRAQGTKLEESIRLFQESIALDESYGPAYLGLATAYALLPPYRDLPLQENLDLAVATIDKGVSVDPSLADPAGAIYGFEHYQRKEWSKAVIDYERAVAAPMVDSNAFSWYSQTLASVGRLHDARDVALTGLNIDPNSSVLNSRVAMVYTWLNNNAKAFEYFRRANDLDMTGMIHNMAFGLLLLRSEKFELARDLAIASAKEAKSDTTWIEPVFRALANPGNPDYAEEGLAAINRTWENDLVIPHIVILARTLLGDVDGAMEIAWLAKEPGEAFSIEILFIDELAPLRQHPDFLALLDSVGVTDYWKEHGCRWQDDRVDCSR